MQKKAFYLVQKKRAKHDREVLTNYVGELIQHDTSHHLWCPDAEKKWALITSIDDHSRRILFGDFYERETSWWHIEAVKTVVKTFGCPLRYYTDNHAIFRYVEKRDRNEKKMICREEDATVQWKEALRHAGIKITYALSPEAKVLSETSRFAKKHDERYATVN